MLQKYRLPKPPLKKMDAAMLSFELLHEAQKMPDGGDMVVSAAEVATLLHAGETRRIRQELPVTPYIEHPMRVALRLVRWGQDDPSLVAAALLHDTLEDCRPLMKKYFSDGTDGWDAQRWMARSYGDAVMNAVAAVTNVPGTPYRDKIAHLCSSGSDAALLVKASDLTDNAGSLPHQLPQTGREKTIRLMHKYGAVLPLVTAELRNRGFDAPAAHLEHIDAGLSLMETRAPAPRTAKVEKVEKGNEMEMGG